MIKAMYNSDNIAKNIFSNDTVYYGSVMVFFLNLFEFSTLAYMSVAYEIGLPRDQVHLVVAFYKKNASVCTLTAT